MSSEGSGKGSSNLNDEKADRILLILSQQVVNIQEILGDLVGGQQRENALQKVSKLTK